ncbi:hypothetical protein MFUR16E_04445 [Methylobacterium fujisawaense]|uniref:hypothetical protein n=1 Tax=Methylobacterium fujisawaense TaxID=107400 RepID=UPI002F33D2E4
MSVTPHRDAVEASLAEMRQRYEAMAPAIDPADAHSRVLTLAVTEVVMRTLGDLDDARGDREAFAHGFTHALGNVVASVASCLAFNEQQTMRSSPARSAPQLQREPACGSMIRPAAWSWCAGSTSADRSTEPCAYA